MITKAVNVTKRPCDVPYGHVVYVGTRGWLEVRMRDGEKVRFDGLTPGLALGPFAIARILRGSCKRVVLLS